MAGVCGLGLRRRRRGDGGRGERGCGDQRAHRDSPAFRGPPAAGRTDAHDPPENQAEIGAKAPYAERLDRSRSRWRGVRRRAKNACASGANPNRCIIWASPEPYAWMRFSDDFLRTLRDRASIVGYASRHLAWDKRKSQPGKGDYWACCPFHHEKSASFHVLDARGIYKCFGCGESGDIFTLSMKLEGGTFPEAVTRIAEQNGVALPAAEREDKETADRRKRLQAAMARAGALYAEALRGPEGRAARAYLQGRGFDAETCARFGIGYAPGPHENGAWTWLTERLKGEFRPEELSEAGLMKPPEDGKRAIDAFRDRVTFEIADSSGRLIAFGGRTLDPNQPAKYINSPETPLFSKSRTLYRLKQAREILAKSKANDETGLVVAEGYFDVVAFERAGIAAVAPMGTALTEDQLQLVWRAGGAPVLCFDGDAAGQRAASRALDLALPHLGPGRTVRIALLPPDEDPDDVFRRAGAEGLKGVLAAAAPAATALFERERGRSPLSSPEAKADFKHRLRAAAGRIADEETRRWYMRELLARADAALNEAWAPAQRGDRGARQARGGDPRRGGRYAPPPQPTAELRALTAARRDSHLERILRLAVDHPQVLDRGADPLAQIATRDGDLERIKSALLTLWFEGRSIDRASVSLHLRQLGELRAAARLQQWPRPKLSAEDWEGDWLRLAAPDGSETNFAAAGETGARVARRAAFKTQAARPRPISGRQEDEWEAGVGEGLAAAAARDEARALRDRVDDDADAMARAQELLKDRLRAAADALRVSRNASDGAEQEEDET
ncbi:MAG: DNA primase [Alphaproteobacteria bacterium]|nr:DNA primase [Alphaproteobacteria bacterium]